MKKAFLNIFYSILNRKWKDRIASGETGVDMNSKYIGYLSGMLQKPTLDAGCGLGRFPADVKIDFEPKSSDVMKVDMNGKLPFEDGKFESIICHNVLEHLDSPTASLKEFRRILKPEGKLLIVVPHENNPGYRIEAHKQFFTQNSLKELVESNKFKIEQIYGFVGTDFFIHPAIQKLIGKIIPNEIICMAKAV